MNATTANPALTPEQREVLGQAMTDAQYYRDPPLECPQCPADGLCAQCADSLARASSYRKLSQALGFGPA